MATSADIQNISDQIRREFSPRKIILFGSHSWGTPSDDSDVDLLVIADFEGKPWRFAVEIRERIRATIPLDLMVRTPEQLRERLAKHDMLLTEIVDRGTVLYEA
ncbi:nucleotidyltransferase domain-containing protein [Geobacter grbiciae]|uniref:nucleotidyltransferase domain-containing protein n=1 Tax=Geobacter grbiciae TaxID=155042 RepID=UPI001C016EC8|nr:nucleotidyltransferase domain-containing protein [Geobacter grbiciae]MBT1076769.1 nucleotidyltransferase domain-containing protein [Geobacter grbiciae]